MVDYTTSNKNKYCFWWADADYECVPSSGVNSSIFSNPRNVPTPPTTLLYSPTSQISTQVYPPYMPKDKSKLNLLPEETGLKPADIIRGPPPKEPNYFSYENQPLPKTMIGAPQPKLVPKTKEGFIKEDFSEAVKESRQCIRWDWFSDFDSICQKEYGPDWIYQGFSQTSCGPSRTKILCKENKLTKSSVPGYLLMNPNKLGSSYDQAMTGNTRMGEIKGLTLGERPVGYTRWQTPQESRGGLADKSGLEVKASSCGPFNLLDYEWCAQQFGPGWGFAGKNSETCIPGFGKAMCIKQKK